MKLRELDIYEVFTILHKGDSLYAGGFDSKDFPYTPSPPVRCNYYSTMLFTKGRGFLVVDNVEYEIKPGRAFTFNDRQVIGWSYYENALASVVAFTPHVASALNIQFDKPYLDIPEREQSLFRNIFQNLISQFEFRDALSEPILRSGIGYLYSLYHRYMEAPESYDSIVTSIRNSVCSDFSKDESVESIAKSLNIPVKELNERCFNKIGLSVKQYIIELKLTEAKRLLAFTEKNASEIAYQIGLEDPSYFARLFKKKTGFSPSGFIKKYRR